MEGVDLSFLAEGTSIPEIIVNSTTMMAGGMTKAIAAAFNGLVLNEAGTGLSALAIWVLSFAGVGFIWKVIPQARRFFTRHR